MQPVDHFLQQVATDLGDARSGVEVGKMSLRKTEITVKAVDQNFERVLQRVEIALAGWIVHGGAHVRLRFEPECAQISQEMSKDLKSIGHRKTIELQHDRGIKRGHIAMPDIARDAGEEDRGITAFKCPGHRHLRNGMAPSEVFAQKERVNTCRITAHDRVLIIVRKNLRLDEITGAEQFRHRTCLAHGAESTLAEPFVVLEVSALQFLAG